MAKDGDAEKALVAIGNGIKSGRKCNCDLKVFFLRNRVGIKGKCVSAADQRCVEIE